MSFRNLTEKKLSSETIFEGRLLTLCKDTVMLSDGKITGREYVRHVGAVCIVPITENDRVVVERQYRYPIGRVTLEVPAGKLNGREEDPEKAARRELLEETGAEAGELIYMGEFYPAAAYTDEIIHLYLARELTFGEAHPDEGEFLRVDLMPLDDLVAEILNGNVPDAKTQAAVLRAYLMLRAGRKD